LDHNIRCSTAWRTETPYVLCVSHYWFTTCSRARSIIVINGTARAPSECIRGLIRYYQNRTDNRKVALLIRRERAWTREEDGMSARPDRLPPVARRRKLGTMDERKNNFAFETVARALLRAASRFFSTLLRPGTSSVDKRASTWLARVRAPHGPAAKVKLFLRGPYVRGYSSRLAEFMERGVMVKNLPDSRTRGEP
jgi:hypothetical protein